MAAQSVDSVKVDCWNDDFLTVLKRLTAINGGRKKTAAETRPERVCAARLRVYALPSASAQGAQHGGMGASIASRELIASNSVNATVTNCGFPPKGPWLLDDTVGGDPERRASENGDDDAKPPSMESIPMLALPDVDYARDG